MQVVLQDFGADIDKRLPATPSARLLPEWKLADYLKAVFKNA